MSACKTAAEISKNDDEALKNSVGAPKTGEKGNSESENEEKSLCIVEGEERGVPRRQKRETSPSSSESKKVKRVRKKTEPQTVLNMKEYVDNNGLEKLTTATLRNWLREKSIHCTTREKKAKLVEKVCKHFLT